MHCARSRGWHTLLIVLTVFGQLSLALRAQSAMRCCQGGPHRSANAVTQGCACPVEKKQIGDCCCKTSTTDETDDPFADLPECCRPSAEPAEAVDHLSNLPLNQDGMAQACGCRGTMPDFSPAQMDPLLSTIAALPALYPSDDHAVMLMNDTSMMLVRTPNIPPPRVA